jgi:hypothetical protein
MSNNKPLTEQEELTILKKTRDRITDLEREGKNKKEIIQTLRRENKLGVLAR